MNFMHFSDYYKNWLKNNPNILDEKPKVKKGETQLDQQEWYEFLENEKKEEREKRRKATLTTMVKQLGGLLGDKATNMYRMSRGRSHANCDEDRSVFKFTSQ